MVTWGSSILFGLLFFLYKNLFSRGVGVQFFEFSPPLNYFCVRAVVGDL